MYPDIVTAPTDDDWHTAVLTVAVEGRIKILRREVERSALSATQKIANTLLRDTTLLLGMLLLDRSSPRFSHAAGKYTIGDQISQQQGYTELYSGVFELNENDEALRAFGPPDDTSTLRRSTIAPRAPREMNTCSSRPPKRARTDSYEEKLGR